MGYIYQMYGSEGKKIAYRLLSEVNPRIDSEMTVGIKPNLVVAESSSSGATTDPELAAGVIEYLHEEGISDIIIMEGSWVASRTEEAFEVCGYKKLANKYNVKLYNLKSDETKTYKSNNFKMEICQAPLKVDYLINMPVLKAHCQTEMTCALKNLKGCIPDREKRNFHSLGLHQPIAQLNTLLSADLIVVDGIIGDLAYEGGGTPVCMNRVLLGTDPVLIDSYAAKLLGLNIEDVPYIKLAEKLGVGSTDLENTEIISFNQAEEKKRLKLEVNSTVDKLRTHIEENQACSACIGSLIQALHRLNKEYSLSGDKKVYIGQGWQDKIKSQPGVGSCTNNFNNNIPGCPPAAKEIREDLIKFWELE